MLEATELHASPIKQALNVYRNECIARFNSVRKMKWHEDDVMEYTFNGGTMSPQDYWHDVIAVRPEWKDVIAEAKALHESGALESPQSQSEGYKSC